MILQEGEKGRAPWCVACVLRRLFFTPEFRHFPCSLTQKRLGTSHFLFPVEPNPKGLVAHPWGFTSSYFFFLGSGSGEPVIGSQSLDKINHTAA